MGLEGYTIKLFRCEKCIYKIPTTCFVKETHCFSLHFFVKYLHLKWTNYKLLKTFLHQSIFDTAGTYTFWQLVIFSLLLSAHNHIIIKFIHVE